MRRYFEILGQEISILLVVTFLFWGILSIFADVNPLVILVSVLGTRASLIFRRGQEQ
jgi:hypothetical protein